jgi:hypothetical protein
MGPLSIFGAAHEGWRDDCSAHARVPLRQKSNLNTTAGTFNPEFPG